MAARPEKVSAVEEITERFKEAEGAILTEYRGLRVAELAEVRGALREADAEYKVMKNTLARIAVRDVGLDELAEMLKGPTAVVFAKGDVAAAAKALDDAAKRFPVLVVKGGALKGGKIFTADQAKALARIEPREVLLAKIAMLVNSPAQQAVNVFAALLRNLGSMLVQVVEKKESGELPGGSGEDEAPVAQATDAAPAAQTTEADETPATDEAPETDETPESTPDQPEDVAPAAQTTEADETPDAPVEEPTPEAAEAEAEEPPSADTEQKDEAAEAAEEASAGTVDTKEEE